MNMTDDVWTRAEDSLIDDKFVNAVPVFKARVDKEEDIRAYQEVKTAHSTKEDCH